MAAGAEVTGDAAIKEMETPVAVLDLPKATDASTEKPVENNFDSDSKEWADTEVNGGVKDSDLNSNGDSKSEMEVKEIVDILKKLKLNPQAKEFFPSSQHHGQMGIIKFAPDDKNLGNDSFPNNQRKRNNYNQNRKRISGRSFRAQREDSIRRTVYVSDIDHMVTEEQLAALFSGFGQVLDCRVCGDPHSRLRFAFVEFADEYSARAALSLCGAHLGFSPVTVLPSKTAILPVNPTFLPRAESAILALDCCGEILGSQRIR
ncbi:nucleolysin TIAR-like [Dorcoceras hygrometricum]|uniref:Nucleolysin TIAR-like n=1 Tax=Dorcoceras hygrometricum TaxID=472368 RepID=A0A2Z7B7L3_9LAMI|nr:nucleolysin TIAR-like [Dorcoceras hygrometricum]